MNTNINPLFFRVVFIVTFVLQAIITFFVYGTITSVVISILYAIIVTIAAGLFVTYKRFNDKTVLTQIMASSAFSLAGVFELLFKLVVK